jgi:signal recognition particle subunit SEC65
MKSYDKLIVWLNYIDSELKVSEGRRVPLHSCVRTPTLDELSEACKKLNLEPEAHSARYPRLPQRSSGYVLIKKAGPKRRLVLEIARELAHIRGQRVQSSRKV